MIVIISILFIILLGIQIPALIKKKLFKEMFAQLLLYSLVIIYTYSYILGIDIPSPSGILNMVFGPLASILFKTYSIFLMGF